MAIVHRDSLGRVAQGNNRSDIKKTILLDKEDSWILDKYYVSFVGRYPVVYIKGKTVRVHSLVMGNPPTGLETDHINRDKLDNRKSNLRFVTRSENLRNRRSFSASGIKGAYFDKTKSSQSKPWKSEAKINGKRKYLGWYSTKEEAGKAYSDFMTSQGFQSWSF